MSNLESSESNHNTKISDSGYSNSCSNSHSQESGSSKSRNSRSHSSSGSSEYINKTLNQNTSDDNVQPKRINKTDRKKKKLKSTNTSTNINQQPNNNATSNNNATTSDAVYDVTSCPSSSKADAEQNNKGECHVNVNDENSESPTNQECTENPIENSHDAANNFVNNLTAPSQINDEIDNNKTTEANDSENNQNGNIEAVNNEQQQQPEQKKKFIKKLPEDGFYCVISMHDGVVLYTSPTITISLSYPQDMWVGRSFIDFIHPKDRSTFANLITYGVTPLNYQNSNNSCKTNDFGNNQDDGQQNSMFVLLRRHRGLIPEKFGIRNKHVSYKPFKLEISFRDAPVEIRPNITTNFKTRETSTVLVITALPVRSFFTESQEILDQTLPKFFTKHTDTGILTHVDSACVSAFGYLPHDIVGRSIMDFYHPEDMPILKETYGMMMKNAKLGGSSFCSPPYRFLIKNGCYVIIQTEWTSFVNPWSRKLALVIGHHRILKGPASLDIFNYNTYYGPKISDDVIVQCKMTKEFILKLLSEPVSRPTDVILQEVSKRCQALSSLIETLASEVEQPDIIKVLPKECDEITASERTSIVHEVDLPQYHDFNDSKSSLEVIIASLNYNENIDRFFNGIPTEIDLPNSIFPSVTKKCSSAHFRSASNLMLNSQMRTDSFLDPLTLSPDNVQQVALKRCHSFASFIENQQTTELKHELLKESHQSISERDSISPYHHDYYGSKSSLDSMLSYKQLNFKENIERFFNSEPTTVGSPISNSLPSTQQTQATDQQRNIDKVDAADSSDSQTGLTSSSDSATFHVNICPSNLTKFQITRHNDDMEKVLINKYRENRKCCRRISDCRSKKIDSVDNCHNNNNYNAIEQYGYGVKRVVAHSWKDNDINKISKCQHTPEYRTFSVQNNIMPGSSTNIQHQHQHYQQHEMLSNYNNTFTPPPINNKKQFQFDQFATKSSTFPNIYLLPKASTTHNFNSNLPLLQSHQNTPVYLGVASTSSFPYLTDQLNDYSAATNLLYDQQSHQLTYSAPAQLFNTTEINLNLPSSVLQCENENDMKSNSHESCVDSDNSSFSSFYSSFVKSQHSDKNSVQNEKHIQNTRNHSTSNQTV